eukprot:scaffold321623_cov32-Prasinocladus_malaysianus.AAC.1
MTAKEIPGPAEVLAGIPLSHGAAAAPAEVSSLSSAPSGQIIFFGAIVMPNAHLGIPSSYSALLSETPANCSVCESVYLRYVADSTARRPPSNLKCFA